LKTKSHQKYKLLDGTIVPSVTTVLQNLGWNKNQLISWARREAQAGNDPDKVRDKAADIGTLAHYLIECSLKNELADVTDYAPSHLELATKAFEAYKQWSQDRNIELVGSELQLVSEQFKFGGTIDLLCKYDGQLSLIDFKTSKDVYADHKIQVSAYKKLLEENGHKIERVFILKISKEDGSYAHHEIPETTLEKGWETFNLLLNLHNLKKSF